MEAVSHSLQNQIQAHTHWINDILLIPNHSALVSASSDVSVKLWRPLAEERQTPATIGLHKDYVKCLANQGSHSDWVASGGLDHKIRIWDLAGAGERLCIDGGDDESNVKGSVYTLSACSSVVASGGPESIVRLWDPRTGKRITKLVGHTDNIRDLLINHDGDTVMSASSDQTVKLAILYSSDRSGLVVKTDLRTSAEWDEGLSLSIAQEQDGVNKVIATGSEVWTATSSSSINRWRDIPSNGEVQLPENSPQHHRWSTSSRSRVSPASSPTAISGSTKPRIPLSCVLRLPNAPAIPGQRQRDLDTAPTFSSVSWRRMSEAVAEQELSPVHPFQDLPTETIEGQQGLIKHVMLNDKRRVLTLDTAGEVLLWDLLQCVPIKSFGKRHLDEVVPEVNTQESVANWCSVDTRTGRLACILEENYCFDAEMYADEVRLDDAGDFRDDQRNDDSLITPRPPNGSALPAVTPGLSIAVATPHPGSSVNGSSTSSNSNLNSTEPGPKLEKTSSNHSQSRTPTDKPKDYFSPNPNVSTDQREEDGADSNVQSPVDGDKEEKQKEGTTLFGKRFRMNFPKKLGRTSVEVKPTTVDEKAEESDKSEEKEEQIVEDNLYGVIQRMRYDYEEQLQGASSQALSCRIFPSSHNETPKIEPPPHTTIIIQEDRPDSGGVTDLYRGTVRSVGHDADQIEKSAPMWLGELLLRNQIPFKDISKVSFVLMPYQDLLPSIASEDGAKKICAYVTERIEPQPEHPDPHALKPEDYLELYCQDKLVPLNTTLATIRAHIWKTGGDVLLYYKSNGRKPELEMRMNGQAIQEPEVDEGVPF
ncbi:MAG: hypothetical protein Q9168_003963 [Polycauliona sp. 1 TL-2023]